MELDNVSMGLLTALIIADEADIGKSGAMNRLRFKEPVIVARHWLNSIEETFTVDFDYMEKIKGAYLVHNLTIYHTDEQEETFDYFMKGAVAEAHEGVAYFAWR